MKLISLHLAWQIRRVISKLIDMDLLVRCPDRRDVGLEGASDEPTSRIGSRRDHYSIGVGYVGREVDNEVHSEKRL